MAKFKKKKEEWHGLDTDGSLGGIIISFTIKPQIHVIRT